MNAIYKMIIEIIEKSDQSDKDKLAQILEDYAKKYQRSYRGLKLLTKNNFEFFTTLEEITDARISNY